MAFMVERSMGREGTPASPELAPPRRKIKRTRPRHGSGRAANARKCRHPGQAARPRGAIRGPGAVSVWAPAFPRLRTGVGRRGDEAGRSATYPFRLLLSLQMVARLSLCVLINGKLRGENSRSRRHNSVADTFVASSLPEPVPGRRSWWGRAAETSSAF